MKTAELFKFGIPSVFSFLLMLKDKYQAIPLSASRLRQQNHLDFHCYLNLFPKTALPPCIPAIGHPQNTRYYFPYPRRWLASCGDLGPKCFLWVLFAPGFLLRLRRRGQEVLGQSAFWELLTRRCHHGIPQQLLLHKARKKNWRKWFYTSHYYYLFLWGLWNSLFQKMRGIRCKTRQDQLHHPTNLLIGNLLSFGGWHTLHENISETLEIGSVCMLNRKPPTV